MSRPRIRIAELSEDSRSLNKGIFATSTNAYRNLFRGHEGELNYCMFQRAWTGEKVKPADVEAIERGWKRWTQATLPTLPSKQGG